MKILLLLTLLVLSSCSKEYSGYTTDNQIKLTITVEPYSNGTNYYWKTTISSNKVISVDYLVTYSWMDGSTKHEIADHIMNKGSTMNIFSTTISTKSSAVGSHIKLIKVTGTSLYNFTLN